MLIERDADLAALADMLAAVPHRGGRLALVSGEAGIGKSSLVAAFLDALDPATDRATGLCDPLDTPRALGPVREVLRSLGPQSPGRARPEDFDATLEALARRTAPAVLVIEDMHWADQGTLDWLKFVGRRISALPVLLVVTFREEGVAADHPLRSALGAIPARHVRRLPLGPLTEAGLAALGPPPHWTPARLAQVSGGNPFLATELIAMPPQADGVPVSIADSVNARLNALAPDLQRALERLSCHPGLLRTAEIAAVGAADLAGDALASGLLVQAGDGLRFRHELTRRAVLARLAPPDRRAAHAAFLDSLAGAAGEAADPDAIVHHALGAGDAAAVLRHAPEAAERAARLGAHAQAAAHLETALAHVAHATDEQAARIHQDWAYEAGLALRVDDAVIAARERAVDLWRRLGRPDRVGDNLRWLSRLHWYRGEADLARRYVTEAIELLDSAPRSHARAMACALRANYHMLSDEMAEAVIWGEKARALAEAAGDEEVRVHALNTIGSARLFRGDPSGEAALLESLRGALAGGFHEQAARVYTNLSECYIEMRALDKAERLLSQGIAFDTAHDLDSWTFYLVGRQAQLRFEQGRFADALAIAGPVLDRAGQTLLMKLPARMVAARTRLRLEGAAARPALDGALADAVSTGEPQYMSVMHVALLEAAALAGDPAAAGPHLDWLSAQPLSALSPRKWGEAGFWARRLGADLPQPPDLPASFAHDARGEARAASCAFEAETNPYLAACALFGMTDPDALAEAAARLDALDAAPARAALEARARVAGL
ncbi:ATP-binding protein, partial [Roseivivax isoporae]